MEANSSDIVSEPLGVRVDAICDLALIFRSEGIMDGVDLIGNQHIGAIASEGLGDAICDTADSPEPKSYRAEYTTISGPQNSCITSEQRR